MTSRELTNGELESVVFKYSQYVDRVPLKALFETKAVLKECQARSLPGDGAVVKSQVESDRVGTLHQVVVTKQLIHIHLSDQLQENHTVHL